MKNSISLLLFVLLFAFTGVSQEISIGKRDKLHSKILQEDREFSVYLPPSYYTAVNQKYPVLYILDGDYNFQYVAGFLELQGAISEIIPEMILVAISGKGTNQYRKNCKPNIKGVTDSGNAEEVANFIEKELIPYVDKNYKTADYKILSGHSVGGIFIVNTAITRPDLFDDYIAISPALWWGDNAMENRMKATWGRAEKTTASLYISLADEKGMEVDRFIKKVPKSIKKKNVHYREFPDEIHNSVGLPTYKWALGEIFSSWYVERKYFDTAEALKKHYAEVQKQYGSVFNIPLTAIGNTHYINQKNEDELKKVQVALKEINPNALVIFNTYRAGKLLGDKKYAEAEQLLEAALAINPNNFDSYNVRAKINTEQGNTSKATLNINKALNLANDQHARQWQVNELLETKSRILKN
ncbi:alpha/beta hydrolase-fold protein [Aequorivita marina]|uniref:alpha/beta hydrolase-fold protein n=1 Tax=Aequorivita marina TaxID=3073654 RepID=UPI0028749C02|nr:alpha/beta hydrolase-fold protein [Aequorivita sp. S2608]MDS1296871.1 alpha/beta hydrolase-fold protein [Aequorivita sp. S2608]